MDTKDASPSLRRIAAGVSVIALPEIERQRFVVLPTSALANPPGILAARLVPEAHGATSEGSVRILGVAQSVGGMQALSTDPPSAYTAKS